jgi:hypothetical protein
MSSRFVTNLCKGWVWVLLIGIGATGWSGQAEASTEDRFLMDYIFAPEPLPGTARNPITAIQAFEWVDQHKQCPLFSEAWRGGSTLDLKVPEIMVRSGRGGPALEIGGRHFVSRTWGEYWAAWPNKAPSDWVNTRHVVQHCQDLYGISQNEAWQEAVKKAGEKVYAGWIYSIATFSTAAFLTQPIMVSVDDPTVVFPTMMGVGVIGTLGFHWVAKRESTEILQKSEIPKLIEELFLKAQAIEKRGVDLASGCTKGLDILTLNSEFSALEKRDQDCKEAIDAYAPQTHAWQTETVLKQLQKNQEVVKNLIRDHMTLSLSNLCDLAGKTSQAELSRHDALDLKNNLSICESLAAILEKVQGSELEAHHTALGMLSIERVQSIIVRLKKAEKARQALGLKAEQDRIFKVEQEEAEKARRDAEASQAYLQAMEQRIAVCERECRAWGPKTWQCLSGPTPWVLESQRHTYGGILDSLAYVLGEALIRAYGLEPDEACDCKPVNFSLPSDCEAWNTY